MTDRPVIFSGPMVRAVLAGRKTQTRRLATSPLRRCEVGDRLYVRETCTIEHDVDGMDQPPPHADGRPLWVIGDGWRQPHYRATDPTPELDLGEDEPRCKWRPSIHMPRWASRLTLIVEAVRVEPLQAISEDDALAEGLTSAPGGWWSGADGQASPTPKGAFALLWSSLHSKPGEHWNDNPAVVALTFRVLRGNIDRLAA